uniref:Uncharacterized protein n=1 Tax=Glycine max TaxID=3847 RepID=C6T0D0_SOYBN|nr:unknown [Glycine max]
MAFKTDERYKISKCYDHELLQVVVTTHNKTTDRKHKQKHTLNKFKEGIFIGGISLGSCWGLDKSRREIQQHNILNSCRKFCRELDMIWVALKCNKVFFLVECHQEGMSESLSQHI